MRRRRVKVSKRLCVGRRQGVEDASRGLVCLWGRLRELHFLYQRPLILVDTTGEIRLSTRMVSRATTVSHCMGILYLARLNLPSSLLLLFYASKKVRSSLQEGPKHWKDKDGLEAVLVPLLGSQRGKRYQSEEDSSDGHEVLPAKRRKIVFWTSQEG